MDIFFVDFLFVTPIPVESGSRVYGREKQQLLEDGRKPIKENSKKEQKIIALLKEENKDDLQQDISLAPVWIQKIMQKALNKEHY